MESIKMLKVKTKKKQKKEKEKKKFTGNGLRIIDDDSFGYGFKPVEDTQEDEEADELPQIASVIDERPVEVQVLETFSQSKWKRVAATEDDLDLDGAQVVEVQRKPQIPDDFDLSPPRPSQNRTAKSKSNRHHSEDDLSPPRPGQRRQQDPSPPRRRRDASPVRKRGRDRDASPPRKRGRSPSLSPPPRSRSRGHTDDHSPPRRHSHGHGDRRDRSHKSRDAVAEIIDCSSETKRKTTLDGKMAGLQKARALKDEMVEFRRKENLMYEALPDEVSGRNAVAVRRDRRTEDDKAKEVEKAKKEAERQQQYNKWGKGIVQVKNQETRVQEALHEISKPLARYKNDEDLDEHLKAIDRVGDPMLEYLASKKRRKTGGVEKPQYKGPQPPPNRFKIPPGYRWDGVDRSNGYEKDWFGQINAKKALEEEAHKWSVEDL